MRRFAARSASALRPSRLALTALLLVGGAVHDHGLVAPVLAQPEARREFTPLRLLPPKPPITDPPVISGADASSKIADNELVLGVTVNGEGRAYPINMLTGPSREIINDVLGDVPIAATWCHLCHNTVVFDRRAGDQTLTFAVSGKLWNRNLVMIDSETESLWSHFLGRAVEGPLEGTRLETFPSVLTTWEQWRKEHPETTALNMSRKNRFYVREFYKSPDEFVLGFVVEGQPHHAALTELQKHPLINIEIGDRSYLLTFDDEGAAGRLFERSLDDTTLEFTPAEDNQIKDIQTGTIWSPQTGEAVRGPLAGRHLTQRVSMPAYTVAWMTFHPKSREIPAVSSSTETD